MKRTVQDMLDGWGMPDIAFYGIRNLPPLRTAWVRCSHCYARFLALCPAAWNGNQLQGLKCVSCGQMTCSVDKGRVG